jgi:hypothetical protein
MEILSWIVFFVFFIWGIFIIYLFGLIPRWKHYFTEDQGRELNQGPTVPCDRRLASHLATQHSELYQKSYLFIPRNETVWPRSHFHIHVSVSDLYIPKIGLPILQADWSWEYINRSQILECRNWERGRAISFLGIHKTDFWSSVKL